MPPSSTLTTKRGTDSPGIVMQAPERRSNSQPWSGQVTMSPSTRPSQRLPPLWAHSLPMAKISSPRRKSATSRPSATTSSTPPSGSAARSRTLVRFIRPPPPPPPPPRRGGRRGGGASGCRSRGGGGGRGGGLRVRGLRVRGLRVRGVPVGLVEELDEVEHLEDRKSTRLNSSHGSISHAVFC